MFNAIPIEWVEICGIFIYSIITYNDIYNKVKNNKLYWLFIIYNIWD